MGCCSSDSEVRGVCDSCLMRPRDSKVWIGLSFESDDRE